MIVDNNAELDVETLVRRVRVEAAALRAQAAGSAAAGAPPPGASSLGEHLRTVADAADEALRRVSVARTRNDRRAAVPRRLRRSGAAGRFFVRAYNYVFKQTREVDDEQNAALQSVAGLLPVLVAVAEELGARLATAEERLAWAHRRIDDNERRLDGVHELAQHAVERADAAASEQVAAGAGLRATVDARLERFMSRLAASERRSDGASAAHDELRERVRQTHDELRERVRHAHERIDTGEHVSAALTRALDDTRERVRHAHERVDAAERSDRDFSARFAVTPTETDVELRVSSLERQLLREVGEIGDRALRQGAVIHADLVELRRTARAPQAAPVPGAAAEPPAAPLSDSLYLALEDRFRGAQSDVSAGLRRYVDRVVSAGTVDAAHPALDLGCGRGEWLRLLAGAGLAARGVDTNALNVSALALDGLDVVAGDALDVLRAAAPGSFGAITAFHLIEHLPFGALVELCELAGRALAPGGIVIFETPNPRRLGVGLETFWLDPSHVRPVPSGLAAFVAEYAGLTDIAIEESAPPADAAATAELPELLARHLRAGEDYALIARRPGA